MAALSSSMGKLKIIKSRDLRVHLTVLGESSIFKEQDCSFINRGKSFCD